MSRLCMKEISRALIEMISDESPYASKDMFRKSVCWKMRLEEEKLLGDKLREILEG